MCPNPQEALPLPPRPSLEQYRKLAKDLVKACRSADPDAMHAWAVRWVQGLAAARRLKTLDTEQHVRESAERVAQFARKELSESGSVACGLTTAQFVIARSHGFLSWPKFSAHLESLAQTDSTVSAYERAVEAIVSGDEVTLARLLRRYPRLARARSTREHGATLLHYVSANGVEAYRQLSPKNIVTMTRMLLAAGADVDATTDVYDGKCTALGLVATSSPPFTAGVQQQVIDILWICPDPQGTGARWSAVASRTASLRRRNISRAVVRRSIWKAPRGWGVWTTSSDLSSGRPARRRLRRFRWRARTVECRSSSCF